MRGRAPWRRPHCRRRTHSKPSLCSWDVLEEARSTDWFANDEPLGPGDASQRAELRVAALDQLPERRGAQAGGDGARALGLKLGAMTRQGLALFLVMRRDVDDEG